MRITRLHLRNYRVYEDPLDLEMPAGLVGIYGANGAGKSTLLESVLFCLWGKARTTKDEIRTSDVGGDCVAEVEFEHEGHLYVVRRTISGQAASVRAQAFADGSQVSEGVRDTGRYVHSILGMDDGSFRASVFAEQKQLAAFSANAPAERRRLVLGLLGVTPLDTARDLARKDSRQRHDQLEQLRGMLPDLDQLGLELSRATESASAAAAEEARLAEESERASAALAVAESEHERVGKLAVAYDSLVKEGQVRRAQLEEAKARLGDLEAEATELEGVKARLASLASLAEGLADAERALGLASALGEAESVLADLPAPADVPRPDPGPRDEARAAAREARRRLAEVEGQLVGALHARDRARRDWERASELSHEEDCPLCGQALGSAFEQFQSHRRAESARAEEALAALEGERSSLATEVERLSSIEAAAEARLVADQESWTAGEAARARREQAEHRLGEARRAAEAFGALVVGDRLLPVEPPSREAIAAEAERRRAAAVECERLRGRLERRPVLGAALAEERDRMVRLSEEVEGLRAKVKELDYRPEVLRSAAEARRAAKEAAALATARGGEARVAAAQAAERSRALALRLDDARAQHAKVDALAKEARHLGRLSELLTSFRNTVVSAIGPRLSAQAAELFAELTDHEYDLLQVDPETYEVQIRDHGRAHGMDRFSGSETDLANLALRVAISEQIRFQSGGAVGLLVLDEVFGPLDEERKERMLGALERLGGRFRQILVVTHDPGVKERLPAAVEVGKLPGRRARARVI